MWLSASSFFYQYFRVYSPVTYGKKYDPEGKYVRHFLPVLKVHLQIKYLLPLDCIPLAPQGCCDPLASAVPPSLQTCCLEAGVLVLPNLAW